MVLDPSLTDVLAMKVYDILRMKKEYDNWMKTITISRLNLPSLRVASDYQVREDTFKWIERFRCTVRR